MTSNLSESFETPTLGAQQLIANGGNIFTYKMEIQLLTLIEKQP